MPHARSGVYFHDHFAALEPRAMLALAPVDGNRSQTTDTDGDIVVVQLAGPGTLFVDQAGPAAGIAVEGSTPDSRLTISVRKATAGNGRFEPSGGVRVFGPLRALAASTTDFFAQGVQIDGACAEAKLGDLAIGADFFLPDSALGTIKFQARRVDGGILGSSTLNFGSMHVGSLTAGLLQRGSIIAKTIATLKTQKTILTTGNINTFAITLAGNPDVVNDLGSASIAGEVSNTDWSVNGSAGKVTMLRADDLQLAGAGVLDSLTVKGDCFAGLDWARLGKVSVAGELRGLVSARDVDADGVSIGAISAETTSQLTIVTSLAPTRGNDTFFPRLGIIKSITFAQGGASDNRVAISAGRVGTFSVTGKASKGLAGDLFTDLLLSLQTENLGRLSVKGRLTGDVIAQGPVKDIRAGALIDLHLSVGASFDTFNELRQAFANGLFVEDLRGFTPPATSLINSLIVAKPLPSRGFSAANPNLSNFFIYAGRINKLDLFTGFADDANAGLNAGIESTFVGKLTLRRISSTFSANNLTAPVLQSLAGAPTNLPVSATAIVADASIGPTINVNDLILRLFFL